MEWAQPKFFQERFKMNKKLIFVTLRVILWLTLPSFLLAQVVPDARSSAPEQCWEKTRPTDPIGCLGEIEILIIKLKADRTEHNRKPTDRDIKILRVHEKRIKTQAKVRIRVARAQEKREEREIKAENKADIFCPDPRRQEEVEILNTNHFNFNRFQAFNRVTITNPFDFPLRIRAVDPNQNSSGDIANLPGGCTITTSRSIRPLLETSGYNSLNYWYTAYALNPQDQRGVARSQTFSLFPGNSFQQMSAYTWVVANFQLNY